jgi:N utilization substance protein A
LLGWRIDIKSEEEKRQEVETQMEALAPGAPVSVLADYGLGEEFIGILLQSGINTVERLGSLTPEDLEGIPGVEHEAVPGIQSAVIAYFNHMEANAADAAEAESVVEIAESEAQTDEAESVEASSSGELAQPAAEPVVAAGDSPSEATT